MQKNILLRLRNITRHLTEKKISILLDYKIILSIIILLNLFSIFLINSISNISALEYSNDTNLEFTFNPTLNLSISGNLSIDNLTPGSSSDSNIIDVNISTNNVSGYSLSATVGSSNNATTNLTNTSNSNYVFTSLNTNDSLTSLTTDNTWGYSYSVDNGTTWSNYSGLPLYTTTGTNLNTTSINSSDTINFKIGARASNTQPLGEYTNVINFKAVANPAPTTFTDAFTIAGKTKHNGYYTMQDMTHSICEAVDIDSNIQLIDVRDDEVYTIAKLKDNNCWMLDNLRLGGDEPITLTNQSTNMVAESWNLPASTNTIGGSADSWTTPKINSDYKNTAVTNYGIGSGKVGVYYNYCATSAGTYCYDNNSGIGNAEYDICPINWHLPTGGTSNSEYQNLFSAYSNSSLNFATAFNATLSGSFQDSSSINQGYNGRFWSRTYFDASHMLSLGVGIGSNVYINLNVDNVRVYGHSIRCLAK